MSTMEQLWEDMSAEQAGQAAMADLVPAGKYEGQIVDVKARVVDKDDSAYYGTQTARCTVELYDVAGRTRKTFFTATGAYREKDSGEALLPTKLGANLKTAFGGLIPFAEALEKAQVNRLSYTIKVLPAKGQWDASNMVVKISGEVA